METADELLAKHAHDLANMAETYVQKHEQETHGGELCLSQRASLVAFLAHRLGVSSSGEGVIAVISLMAEYEGAHVETHEFPVPLGIEI